MSYSRYNNDSYSTNGYGSGGGYGGGSFGYDGHREGGSYDKQSGLGSNLHSIDWSHQALAKFEKNFYHEDKRVSERSEREIQRFRDEKEIKVFIVEGCIWHSPYSFGQVFGRNVPKPIFTFEEAGFPSYLMTTINAQGFPSPTPIQSQAWPMALGGRDMVGIAQTGELDRTQ